MHRTDLWWSVLRTPFRLGQIIVLFLVVLEQISNGAGRLLQLPRCIEQIHDIVFVADLVWQTACPGFDLVQLVILLVVARFAHVDLFVRGKVSRPPLVVPRHKHDEAAIHNLINAVIAILSSLDHLILQEMPVEAMDCLLGAVVPAGIHPLATICVLPGAVNLSHNRLCQIVGVRNMYPVANLP